MRNHDLVSGGFPGVNGGGSRAALLELADVRVHLSSRFVLRIPRFGSATGFPIMNGERGLLTYDPSAKAVIFTRADEIETSNSRSYRTTFLVRNSLRRGNRPHQRSRVDLIRYSSLREVDQCEQQELGTIKKA
jgi:hypothetical protein